MGAELNYSVSEFLPSNRILTMCKGGMIVPALVSSSSLSRGNILAQGIIDFIVLAYLFVGVSIIEERFMAAIEVITSKQKQIAVKKPNGETQIIRVRIWNETVSNLSLMALGSSTPVILIPLIGVIGYFQSGDLGLGTIVGSGAFNMFVIMAICVWAIPSGENRRIKNLRVFIVTITWSVFSYIWLFIILYWSSPGTIEVWEGIVTFLFFPTTILTAYIADQKFLIFKYLSKKYHNSKRRIIVGGEDNGEQSGVVEKGSSEDGGPTANDLMFVEVERKKLVNHRQKYIQLLREVMHKNPEKRMEELELISRKEILSRGTNSRAIYRLQATKKWTGGGNLIKKLKKPELPHKMETEDREYDVQCCRIYFHSVHYTVIKSVGQFPVPVSRLGDLSCSIYIDFETDDGTAKAGLNYERLAGTLLFRPDEEKHEILLTIIDADFEGDGNFYVKLSNPRYLNCNPNAVSAAKGCCSPGDGIHLELATIMILQDNHPGMFGFSNSSQEVPESVGKFQLMVQRRIGVRGRVMLSFRTLEGTAVPEKDYTSVDGVLIFENYEKEKNILIHIVNKESYERDSIFYVELGCPRTEEDYLKDRSGQPNMDLLNRGSVDLSENMTKPGLSNHYKIQLRIKESKEFKITVDNLIENTNVPMNIGTTSWKEQFLNLIMVRQGDDDGDDEQMCSCSFYVIHFFTIFWKVLFAFVPPTKYLGGWACFITSFTVIGMLTVLVCDTALHLGCTVGLKDLVTAILLLAVGTNVPDVFACKIAAQNDKYADSSIGHVMCSNAVNVFLGIGLSWSIAALNHAYFNRSFRVNPGNLLLPITLFFVFAFVCCIVLLLRRNSLVGGELGGPMRYKLPTVILFVGLWLFYVVTSSLQAYDIIPGF